MTKRIFKDDFGNRAEITTKKILPFKESRTKETTFILKIYAEYENDFLYHLSCYESIDDAIRKLNTLSCKTFKEIYNYDKKNIT